MDDEVLKEIFFAMNERNNPAELLLENPGAFRIVVHKKALKVWLIRVRHQVFRLSPGFRGLRQPYHHKAIQGRFFWYLLKFICHLDMVLTQYMFVKIQIHLGNI